MHPLPCTSAALPAMRKLCHSPFPWCAMTQRGRCTPPLHVASLPRWLPWCAAALLCAAAIVTPPAHAAMWKWIDSNGRVVYSDIPPAGDVQAERVSGPAPRANPNAVKDLVSQEADLKKRQMQ